MISYIKFREESDKAKAVISSVTTKNQLLNAKRYLQLLKNKYKNFKDWSYYLISTFEELDNLCQNKHLEVC